MAIRGSLKEASLPDVLQLLSMGKKTGCLSVSHRNNFGAIYFDRGRITYASIVNRRDRIGDMLVRTGIITMEQLQAAIDTQSRRRDKRLGELLVEQDVITMAQLRDCIRVQIEEAVFFLFTWTQGTFNFEADTVPESQDVQVSINPESLLLEGARRVDEWGLIEKKVPSFDVVFEVERARVASTDAEITSEQRAVLDLVDGVRDVQAIIDASGMIEFEVGKALYGLASAGFIQRVGVSARTAPSPSSDDARVEEHRNLGIAFYKTGMFDEALREFRRVLDLRASDPRARVFVGLSLARQGQWRDASAALSDAAAQPNAGYAVFHNLAYVLEREGRFADARKAIEEAMRRGGASDARVRTAHGVVLLLAGEIEMADDELAAAREAIVKGAPSAPWYHYAALAAALRGDLPRATATLAEGIANHPRAVPLANNLGAVLMRRGMAEDARMAWIRALELDPDNPMVRANLAAIDARAEATR